MAVLQTVPLYQVITSFWVQKAIVFKTIFFSNQFQSKCKYAFIIIITVGIDSNKQRILVSNSNKDRITN